MLHDRDSLIISLLREILLSESSATTLDAVARRFLDSARCMAQNTVRLLFSNNSEGTRIPSA